MINPEFRKIQDWPGMTVKTVHLDKWDRNLTVVFEDGTATHVVHERGYDYGDSGCLEETAVGIKRGLWAKDGNVSRNTAVLLGLITQEESRAIDAEEEEGRKKKVAEVKQAKIEEAKELLRKAGESL